MSKYSIIDDIYFAKRGNLESINLNGVLISKHKKHVLKRV